LTQTHSSTPDLTRLFSSGSEPGALRIFIEKIRETENPILLGAWRDVAHALLAFRRVQDIKSMTVLKDAVRFLNRQLEKTKYPLMPGPLRRLCDETTKPHVFSMTTEWYERPVSDSLSHSS